MTGRPRMDESLCEQSLAAAHKRLRTRRGPAKNYKCIDCGEEAYDWSRRHGETGFMSDHYDPRCRSCHAEYDFTEQKREKMSTGMTKSWEGRRAGR